MDSRDFYLEIGMGAVLHETHPNYATSHSLIKVEKVNDFDFTTKSMQTKYKCVGNIKGQEIVIDNNMAKKIEEKALKYFDKLLNVSMLQKTEYVNNNWLDGVYNQITIQIGLCLVSLNLAAMKANDKKV